MKTKNLTQTALMAAVLCLLAPISFPIGTVSLTLATFVLYLTAYILPPKLAAASVGLYLFLGAAGLPVFAGYLAGIGRFAAPGGGYLIGYLFLVTISSWFLHRYADTSIQLLGMVIGTAVMYLLGTFWMAAAAGISFYAALPAGVLIFLPFDSMKILLAFWIGKKIRLHLK